MKKGEGFLMLELAVSLGLISIFFALLAGYLAKTADWQVEAISQIKAINYASSCLERNLYNSSSDYEVTFKNDQLHNVGLWAPKLQPYETQELQQSFNIHKLSVTWQTHLGTKRSYSLIYAQSER